MDKGGNRMNEIVIDNIQGNAAQVESQSYFDGGLLQYIGWSILGFLVTICTFGICYPWSITMILSWKARHTVINGRRLEFKGTALGLFGNWIKWWLLTIITLGIYSFWLFIAVEKWKTKHTVFVD
jgi:uncharacterized membrane protein YjgN (DUF898 family)